MIYRISGGIFLVLFALSLFGGNIVPSIVLGIFALVAGIALLAGV